MNTSALGVTPSVASGVQWRFADCEFDESRLELHVKGNSVDLELKPLEILIQLLHRVGEIVTKDELLDAVWPGLEVVEASLTTAVHKLRKALADDRSNIVVTVPRVGYRLGVSVEKRSVRSSTVKLSEPLKVGLTVPGRPQWKLVSSMDTSPHSEVWLAENAKTHALRVFKFASNAARVKALRREVTVFRFLRESLGEREEFARILEWNFDSEPYYVESEYGGLNLSEWADKQGGLAAIALEERVCVAAEICRAVAIAHGAGVLHKDLKPANILMCLASDGTEYARIVDFGSASLLEPARLEALGITNLGFTQTGSVPETVLTGTLMYLAPEIFSGHRLTATSDVYALGVLLYQLVIGDFRKPIAPGWEAMIPDAILREDIALAVHGEPSHRLRSAADLSDRLLQLERRRVERQRGEALRIREAARQKMRMRFRASIPWILSAAVSLVAAFVLLHHQRVQLVQKVEAVPSAKSVAVLPFQNIGADSSVDFLRAALPNEIATTLSYNRGLSIRPFRLSSKASESNSDLQSEARAMGVKTVITGNFLKQGNQLEITIEAFDAQVASTTWRDTLDLPSGDLIQMHSRVTSTIRDGLASVLGSSSKPATIETDPHDVEAYKLYLESLSMNDDIRSNSKAIEVLDRATRLDPEYAPAWSALALRHYNLGSFGAAGETEIRKAEIAAEHAEKLDPNLIRAGDILGRILTEDGQLVKAYREAADLIKRRPDSGYSHFTMSYVLRYAGLLQPAAHQCELARETDPHDPGWRSCLSVYEQLGDFQRAEESLSASAPDSPWTPPHQIQQLVREGKYKEAQAIKRVTIPGWDGYNLLQACAGHRPQAEIDALTNAVKPDRDSELNYAYAAHLSFCGKMPKAVQLLKLSIKGGHCGYPAMETDPLMANMRAQPEYAEIRAEAINCQNQFLAELKEAQLPVPSSLP